MAEKSTEKAFELAQKLLRLKVKRPDIFRIIWALVCSLEG